MPRLRRNSPEPSDEVPQREEVLEEIDSEEHDVSVSEYESEGLDDRDIDEIEEEGRQALAAEGDLECEPSQGVQELVEESEEGSEVLVSE